MVVKFIKKKEYPEKAAVQLIRHLSEGAYTTFAKAVKELIINAFDAGATSVKMQLSKDFTELTIIDNGEGMSSQKFNTEFARIAGSKRRIGGKKRPFNRPIIGKFGIGFLSIARLCDTAVIYSKQKGDKFGICREVPFAHLFDANNQLKILEKYYYYYSLPRFKDNSGKSYTKIVLKDIRPDIREDLKSECKYEDDGWSGVDELSGIERFKWELGISLPVNYVDKFPVYNNSTREIDKIIKDLDSFNFRVFLNKKEILKPICLGYNFHKDLKWNYDKKKISKNNYGIKTIKSPVPSLDFHGYIYNQRSQIQPSSLRGILLRINHVGIKGYSKSLFEFTKNIGPIQAAISGEILLGPQFEEVLTLDKDDFKEDHPLFKELVGYIHNEIVDVADESRRRSAGIISSKKQSAKIKSLDLSSRQVEEAQKILGKQQFLKQYFPDPEITIKTNIKNLKTQIRGLTGKTISSDESSYLMESLECYNSNCFRGSILMAWNTGMYRVHRKIEKNIGWTKLNQEITAFGSRGGRGELHACNSIDDLKTCSEKKIYMLLPSLNLMTSSTAKLFWKSLIEIRHICAHPTGHKALDAEAILMIKSVLARILNDPKFKII